VSARAQPSERGGACSDCRRRSWLLASLGATLDYRSRRPERLLELLALSDEELLRALAGSRAPHLKAAYARFDSADLPQAKRSEPVCCHHPGYPTPLRRPAAPRMLNVAGGRQRLAELSAAPVIAIAGTARATDYGVQMAGSMSRGLAVSGLTIACSMADGIAAAAIDAATRVGGATVVVWPGGLDVACSARSRSRLAAVLECGCAISELPAGSAARPWTHVAAARTLAGLATLVVVVEAEASAHELVAAHVARELAKVLAAVPGRVSSRASSGAHELLMSGAKLVRGPGDVLELLCLAEAPPGARRRTVGRALEPHLRATLEGVSDGLDTPQQLANGERSAAEVLLSLSELELLGLVARGDGGRYVLREPWCEDCLTDRC
jgi:DNA processing protein